MEYLLKIFQSKFGIGLLVVMIGLVTLAYLKTHGKPLASVLPLSHPCDTPSGDGATALGALAAVTTAPAAPLTAADRSYVTVDANEPGGGTYVCPLCRLVVIHLAQEPARCPECRKALRRAVYAGEGHMLTKGPATATPAGGTGNAGNAGGDAGPGGTTGPGGATPR